MKTPFDEKELLQLVGELVAETLSPAKLQYLEQLLQDHPEARRLYLDYMDIHFSLYQRQASPVSPLSCERFQQMRQKSDRRTTRLSTVIRYGLVAAIVLAATLFIQQIVIRSVPSAPSGLSGHMSSTPPEYVATLRATHGCVWENAEDSYLVESRLLPGVLCLKDGTVRLSMDAGTDIVLEGPTKVNLQTDDSARLLFGTVVLRSSEASVGFTLETPLSTLRDIGTEFAVTVDSAGDMEIHVFEGAVECSSSDTGTEPGQTRSVAEGHAVRFSPQQPGQGVSVPIATNRFVRSVPSPVQKEAPEDNLLLYDGFDYDAPELPAENTGNGGKGWAGPWRAGPWEPGLALSSHANRKDTLSSGFQGVGTFLVNRKGGAIRRRLKTPLRLDQDGVYYLSFLLQRRDDGKRHRFELRMEKAGPHDTKRMWRLGTTGPRGVWMSLAGKSVHCHMPLEYDTTYLFVAKLVASQNLPDQAFISVYRANAPYPEEAPSTWSLSSRSIKSDLILDDLWIFMSKVDSTQWVDEIRLGTTWDSVTAPWQTSGEK